MVTLFFDSENPLDCFDNPNCFFDENGIGRRREPGDPGYVEWYPPGYVPPKPRVKRKPRRRSTLSPLNPQPSNTAMAFEYVIIPNPKNPARPFRARPALGDQVTEGEYLDAVAADSGIARTDVEKVLKSAIKAGVAYARDTRQTGHILDLFRFQPAIGGSFTTNEPSGEEVKAGIVVNLIAGPETLAALLDGLTVEKVDETGTTKPEVENVTLSPGGTPNVYSTTAGLRCSGDHLRASGPNQPWPSAYLLDEALANPVQLTIIACSQTEMLIAPPPTGTTGTKRLKVIAGWNDDIEFLYPVPLTLAT